MVTLHAADVYGRRKKAKKDESANWNGLRSTSDDLLGSNGCTRIQLQTLQPCTESALQSTAADTVWEGSHI